MIQAKKARKISFQDFFHPLQLLRRVARAGFYHVQRRGGQIRSQLVVALFSWKRSPGRRDRREILFFNLPYGLPLVFSDRDIPPGWAITTKMRRFSAAAAVVFHVPELRSLKGFRKRAGQLWVAWWQECEEHPHHAHLRDPAFMRLFDLTMSYHRAADVFVPYCLDRLALPPEAPPEGYSPRRNLLEALRSRPRPKSRERLAALFLSSPEDMSGRREYAMELMKHIDIHSYGKWMRNRTLPRDLREWTKLETIAGYKFTLAFENAIAEDYVTEKFFEPLEVGSVPVYLGAPNVDEFAPGDRCYINVADFSGPKELADYLLMLDRDDAAYEEYHAWRARPFRSSFIGLVDSQRVHAFTRLCYQVESRLRAAARPPERLGGTR